MSTPERDQVSAALSAAAEAHRRLAASDLEPIAEAGRIVRAAVLGGHTILVFGNGGSATDAQHFASELVGRFVKERGPLPAISLAADVAVLTSIGNDYGFERVFERQVRAQGKAGDVCFAISTSGNSPNVLRALQASREMGLQSIALTGTDGGKAGKLADVHVNVEEHSTARIQEVHRTLIHAICEIVEAAL